MPRRTPLLVCHTTAVRRWQTAGWLLALWTSTWSVSAQQPGDTGRKTIVRGSPVVAKQALVIGNSGYPDAPLRCPGNDAADVGTALQGLGFKVTQKTNLKHAELEAAIRTFGSQVRKGDVAVFYFSGHGTQVQGVNYLIPIQMDAQSEDEIKYKAVPADMVLDKLERAGSSVNIVILDACRNNPFKRYRSLMQGLATMSAPQGTLLAYATAPGSVALDGDGDARNSPYTKHLVQSLKEPGLDVERVFKRVRVNVLDETKNRQVPWESSSLVGEFFFVPALAVSTQPKSLTAEVTVREVDERGPLVSGAKVSLWWRFSDAGSSRVLAEGSTDNSGIVRLVVRLTPEQQARGEFAAQALRGATRKSLPLTSFPATTRFSMYLPRLPSSPTAHAAPVAGSVIENSLGMKLVLIPAGAFLMGSPDSDREPTSGDHQTVLSGRVRGDAGPIPEGRGYQSE
ncbi:MAG: caspase family protein [Planctomycetota bacterium]|nr:caspase family protein [Planctomycetota bacterium]